MRLYYFACAIPNFGYELNPWLWPQLLPQVFDGQSDDGMFVGIGTLLNTRLPSHPKTVIFGTGCGNGPVPSPVPKSWNIYGVRGPMSAQSLGLPKEASVGDPAILLRTLSLPKPPLLHPVSFMPHFHSAILGKWPEVCRMAGIHYIGPDQPVENVIHDIRASGRVITGAMHGAIVADALRVPWTAVRPYSQKNIAKWSDWTASLDIEFNFIDLPATTPDEIIHGRFPPIRGELQRIQQKLHPAVPAPDGKVRAMISRPFVPQFIRQAFIPGGTARAASVLTASLSQAPFLSNDTTIDRVTTRLLERIDKFRHDHAAGKLSSFAS